MTNDELKKSGHFHLADPKAFSSLQEFAEWLDAIFTEPCSVWEEDGDSSLYEIKWLVDFTGGLKIEVYPDEHPPPHFHVKAQGVNASFDIENCIKLAGTVSSIEMKKIKFWHKHSKHLLIEAWNKSRPTNCTVGKYNGT